MHVLVNIGFDVFLRFRRASPSVLLRGAHDHVHNVLLAALDQALERLVRLLDDLWGVRVVDQLLPLRPAGLLEPLCSLCFFLPLPLPKAPCPTVLPLPHSLVQTFWPFHRITKYALLFTLTTTYTNKLHPTEQKE